MNKLITIRYPRNFFHPTFVAVESVTDEGNPVTWATIYRSKHGRLNMIGVANGRFIAGGRSKRNVERYARTVHMGTTRKVFVGACGRLVEVA